MYNTIQRYNLESILHREFYFLSKQRREKTVKLVAVCTTLLVALTLYLSLFADRVSGCGADCVVVAQPEQSTCEEEKATQTDATYLKDEWGIEVIWLRETAAGLMLDFRYRVVDSDKAADLFKREIKPYLIDQKTKKVLGVPVAPKLGPMRTTYPPAVGKNYTMLFGNTTRLVKKGDVVTIVVGDFKLENVTVR